MVGEPKSILKNSFFLSTGADGQGSIIFNYVNFEAIIMYSKIVDSYLPSEIQGEKGVIEIDKISDPQTAVIKYRDGITEDLSIIHNYNIMYYELDEFIRSVKRGQIESNINTHEISKKVVRIAAN